MDVPQAKEQTGFNVKVNFLDQLLVEGEPPQPRKKLESLLDESKFLSSELSCWCDCKYCR